MSNVSAQIDATIRAFVTEIESLVRQAALAAVSGALGGSAAPAAKRGPGRPRKIAAAAPAAAAAPRAARRSKGGKRPPALLAKTTEALLRHVVNHPGQRIEQIGKAMGTATKDLALPTKKLLASKSISRKGQKRATTYWPVAKK